MEGPLDQSAVLIDGGIREASTQRQWRSENVRGDG